MSASRRQAPRARFGKASSEELLLSGAFVLLGCAVLAGLLASGHILTGGENQVAADQLQYLSWIVSSSSNWTIGNLWTIPGQNGSSFVQPGFLVSGLLARAGLSPIVSFQIWKPFALLAVTAGFVLYVRRLVQGGGPRTVALALAFFGLTPVGAVAGWGQLAGGWRAQLEFAAGELFAGGWIWGYMMTAIAVALIPLGLLACERALSQERWQRWTLIGSVCALFCSWLQPWQGAELAGAVILCAFVAPGRPSFRTLGRRHGAVVIAAFAPLVYYRWLAGSDPAWQLAADANNSIKLWSVWVWVAAFSPFLLAVPAWLSRPTDWQETALRLVPALMVAEYFAIAVTKSGTFPFHAVQGMGLFMAILTVWSGLKFRSAVWWGAHKWVVASIVFLLCVPGTLHRINLMRLEVHRSAQPYFLTEGENAALTQLAHNAPPGGVLAPIKFALSVPGRTGRAVWVGQISWTPNFRERVAVAEAFFKGKLRGSLARDFVTKTKASFLLSDCGHRTDLTPILGRELIEREQRFGCATLYTVRRPPS